MIVHPLDTYNLCYMATVYSKHKRGIHVAFVEAAQFAARLLQAGVSVYSPIAHTHPLAIYGNIDPLDHDIWIPFDEAMMSLADALLVIEMPGWKESRGVQHEIQVFKDAGKPIHYLPVEMFR